MAVRHSKATEPLWQRLIKTASSINWQPSPSVLALADQERKRNLPWVLLLAALGSTIADMSFHLAQQPTRLTVPLIISHTIVSLLCVYFIRYPTKNINAFFIGAYLYLALTIAIPSILFERPSDLVQLGILSMATFYIILDLRYLFVAQAMGLSILTYALVELQTSIELDDTIWVALSIGVAGLMLHIGRRKSVSRLDDTTRALQIEAHLRQHAEEQSLIARRREELAAMVGGVAHDFNNLLFGISGGLEIARLDNNISPASAQALALANDSALAAKDLCANLLEHTKGSERSHTSIAVAELINTATQHVELISSPQCTIESKTDNLDEEIFGQQGQLRQVLINLLHNAIQAATSKVLITAKTSFADDARWVTITVEDDGSGIDRNVRKQIFEPFFSTRSEGKGLGLATVAATVVAHGGSILVEDSTLGGASFVATLPSAMDSHSKRVQENNEAIKSAPLLSLENIIANIFDDLPYLVFYKDTNNRNLKVNAMVGKLRGLPLEQFENTSVEDWHPDEAHSYYKDDQEVINTGSAKYNIREQVEISPGKKYWFLTDKYPTFAENKTVNGILAICKLADPEDEISLRRAIESQSATAVL